MALTVFDPTQTPAAYVGSQNIINIIINGGFEVWQRGTTFNNAVNGAFTADRWKHDHSAGVFTVNITQETTIKDSGNASLKMDVSSVTSGTQCTVYQYVENVKQLSGRTLTVTARVRTNVANKIRLELSDAASASYSAYHSGGGTFETLTVTRAMGTTTGLGDIHAGCGFNSDTVVASTTYIDSFMMVIGSVSTPYAPEDSEIELARCQRYYEKSYDVATAPGTVTTTDESYTPSVQSIGGNYVGNVAFKVTKRAAPTITFYNASTGSSGSWRAYATAGTDGNISPTAAATAKHSFQPSNGTNSSPLLHGHWTAEAEF